MERWWDIDKAVSRPTRSHFGELTYAHYLQEQASTLQSPSSWWVSRPSSTRSGGRWNTWPSSRNGSLPAGLRRMSANYQMGAWGLKLPCVVGPSGQPRRGTKFTWMQKNIGECKFFGFFSYLCRAVLVVHLLLFAALSQVSFQQGNSLGNTCCPLVLA